METCLKLSNSDTVATNSGVYSEAAMTFIVECVDRFELATKGLKQARGWPVISVVGRFMITVLWFQYRGIFLICIGLALEHICSLYCELILRAIARFVWFDPIVHGAKLKLAWHSKMHRIWKHEV
ncbi:unnamed protein product [Vicia faba]|uniref:Uncharacterized protein n=1 Tax=Vicia faba TaxID=3906 RepID=A0AAV0ZXG7_VICFA|nr:unnamed protein product [Vicia faba]